MTVTAKVDPFRPLTLLIAAMGGEGGGVLADWVVNAARKQGLLVQSTSIPGVAQRTGATTYYIEIGHQDAPDLTAKRSVMALYPGPGDIDVMVASELLEAGRAIERGFVTPDRTTLVGSSSRVFAIAERASMGDGRFDMARVIVAAEAFSKQAVLFDMAAETERTGTIISAVMFGAIAGSKTLPIPLEIFEEIIQESGKAVESNLAGFHAGYQRALSALEPAARVPAAAPDADPEAADPIASALLPEDRDLWMRVEGELPSAAVDIVKDGARRLLDYQDRDYAILYLDHLQRLQQRLDSSAAAGDDTTMILRETARWLALRMSYEDVFRVAQVKTRPERLGQVRREVRAGESEPILVTDFLKPGPEEISTLMPAAWGDMLQRTLTARGWQKRGHIGLKIRTSAAWGYALMRGMAALRRWRRRSRRYRDEHANIETWLQAVGAAAALSRELALAVVAMARLIKGYSDTLERGSARFHGIMATFVTPTLAGDMDPTAAARAINAAIHSALADEAGEPYLQSLQTAVAPNEKDSNDKGAAVTYPSLAMAAEANGAATTGSGQASSKPNVNRQLSDHQHSGETVH